MAVAQNKRVHWGNVFGAVVIGLILCLIRYTMNGNHF